MRNIKKTLAFLLAFVMVLSIVPMTAFATETEDWRQIDTVGGIQYFDAKGEAASANDFVVSTSKTIAPTGVENEFEITLGVQTTVEVEEIPTDPDAAVVLVIDTSGSMEGEPLAQAKKAAKDFIDSYVKDATGARRLSIVIFYNENKPGSRNTHDGVARTVFEWTELTNEGAVDSAKDTIDSLTAQLGTFTQGGLMLARNLYLPNNAPKVEVDGEQKVIDNRFVILLTDGDPTFMLGTTNWWGNSTSTPDLSSEATDKLFGNHLNGTGGGNDITHARNAAAAVAVQIKEGAFTTDGGDSNYSAQLYTIGFNMSDNANKWLKETVASAKSKHYTADSVVDLNDAFSNISEIIKRFTNAWIVTDPMAEHIAFDSIIAEASDLNAASFSENTLTWNIRDSDPFATDTETRANINTTIYSYSLKYKVKLDNLNGYAAEAAIPTNGETTLTYVMADKKLTDYEGSDFITVDFTIPAVHGFDADLTFSKVDGDSAALAGAEFTLTSGNFSLTATSTADGKVKFEGIPSGHTYTLTETAGVEGHKLDETVYDVTVSYGDLAIAGVADLDSFAVVNNKIKTTLTIEKVWLDENGVEYEIAPKNAEFEAKLDYEIVENITSVGTYDVVAGTYHITENAIDGFELVEIDGEAATSAEVTIETGEQKTVTFTNKAYVVEPDKATLIIEKVWLDENGEAISVEEAAELGYETSFMLGEDGLDIKTPGTYENMLTGEYTITEEYIGEEVSLVSIVVSGDDNADVDLEGYSATVNLVKDGTVTVTFTNKLLPVETVGKLTLEKVVVDGDERVAIAEWLVENVAESGLTPEQILNDISFDIYRYDPETGDRTLVDGAKGVINQITNQIDFGDYKFEPGWYVIHEELGEIAGEVFKETEDLIIYFNGKTVSAKTGTGGATIDPDATFTITQDKSETRPLQALYRDEEGTVRYLRNAPALNVEKRPNNGGGALNTTRFTSTSDAGVNYTSFCADIGAIGVKGTYVVDPTNHGLTEDEVLRLVAAIDYIYSRSGFEAYEDIALAQLVVWNMVLEFSDDPMIADLWLRNISQGLLYKDAWGELIKIEGYNNTNGKNYWYTPEYKALIDDILDNMYTDKYLDLYHDRVVATTGSYVSGAVFLIGDGSFAPYYQQRQVLILFDDPAIFENYPEDPVKVIGEIELSKVVLENRQSIAIDVWLSENFTAEEVAEILKGISFDIYASDVNGVEGEKLNAIGKISEFGNTIKFYNFDTDGDGNIIIKDPYDFDTGWYLVKEVLTGEAAKIFKAPAQLVIHFNKDTGAVSGGDLKSEEIPAGTTFTITQYKGDTRPLQAIYKDENGTLRYLRNAPALDVEKRPNNGGGALSTTRFTAESSLGETYTSFCGDLGAIGVKGTYVIDETNFGLTDYEVELLVAAIDYIYSLDGFEEYEDIALAQIIVWNMVLEFSDSPMIADLWLRNIADGLRYTEAWGTLIKVEGYNNTNGKNYWYTPEYKALVNDILARPEYFLSVYNDAILAGNRASFVSGAVFLIGDGSYANYYQQRQVLIQFGEAPVLENIPDDTVYYEVTFRNWDDSEIAVEKVAAGGEVTTPTETDREGYDFVGWYDAIEGGELVEDFTNITGDMTVWARYEEAEAETFTVTFLDWDETVIGELQTVKAGEEIIPPVGMLREGYKFVGWYDAIEGGTEISDFSVVDADLTVWARYELDEDPQPETFTVTFLGLNDELIKDVTVNAGDTATAPAAPVLEGYSFKGWVDAEGNEVSDFTNITANLTVWAKYELDEGPQPETYTLTVINNGESKTLTVEMGVAFPVGLNDGDYLEIYYGEENVADLSINDEGDPYVVEYLTEIYTVYIDSIDGNTVYLVFDAV